MNIKRTFKYRLKPSVEQSLMFAKTAGSCRFLYNLGLSLKKEKYENEKISLSYYELNNLLPGLKNEKTWLSEIHSQVLQQSLKDLDSGFKHFFRRIKKKQKPGFPKFKRKGEHDSFRYPQGVKVDLDKVYLPKIGWIRFVKSRKIKGQIKQVTIVKEASHWYVCFSCEILKNKKDISINKSNAVGIDVGVSAYATIAKNLERKDIEKVNNPTFLKKSLKKLKYLSRKFSKKKKRSVNRNKAKIKLSKLYIKIKNSRKDFAHKLSSKIVKNHDIICVESLAITTMLENAPKYLARSISDAGWGKFLEYLKYKAKDNGKIIIEANRYFPSSKTCSKCEKVNEISLKDRSINCSCGSIIDRDDNAAINLLKYCLKGRRDDGLKPVELLR
jgi:putative transposase